MVLSRKFLITRLMYHSMIRASTVAYQPMLQLQSGPVPLTMTGKAATDPIIGTPSILLLNCSRLSCDPVFRNPKCAPERGPCRERRLNVADEPAAAIALDRKDCQNRSGVDGDMVADHSREQRGVANPSRFQDRS